MLVRGGPFAGMEHYYPKPMVITFNSYLLTSVNLATMTWLLKPLMYSVLLPLEPLRKKKLVIEIRLALLKDLIQK